MEKKSFFVVIPSLLSFLLLLLIVQRLVFDLVNDVPKNKTKTVGINTISSSKIRKQRIPHKSPPKQNTYVELNNLNNYKKPNDIRESNQNQKASNQRKEAKMDIYYFDHGNSDYYRTTDAPPVLITESLAEKTEYYTTKFWAQIFGTFHVGISFIISFLLQLIRFILHAIIRPLTIGLVQLIADYFIKPLLTVTFNGFIQPILIFFYNIATSVRDFIKPVADSVGYFIREIAELCRAFRLVHYECKCSKPIYKCECEHT